MAKNKNTKNSTKSNDSSSTNAASNTNQVSAPTSTTPSTPKKDKFLAKIEKICNTSSIKNTDDLCKSAQKQKTDILGLLTDMSTDQSTRFYSNGKILKQYMSDHQLIKYNVKDDKKNNDYHVITIVVKDKDLGEEVTLAQLAKEMREGFKGVNDRLDVLEDDMVEVKGEIKEVKERLDKVETDLADTKKNNNLK